MCPLSAAYQMHPSAQATKEASVASRSAMTAFLTFRLMAARQGGRLLIRHAPQQLSPFSWGQAGKYHGSRLCSTSMTAACRQLGDFPQEIYVELVTSISTCMSGTVSERSKSRA